MLYPRWGTVRILHFSYQWTRWRCVRCGRQLRFRQVFDVVWCQRECILRYGWCWNYLWRWIEWSSLLWIRRRPRKRLFRRTLHRRNLSRKRHLPSRLQRWNVPNWIRMFLYRGAAKYLFLQWRFAGRKRLPGQRTLCFRNMRGLDWFFPAPILPAHGGRTLRIRYRGWCRSAYALLWYRKCRYHPPRNGLRPECSFLCGNSRSARIGNAVHWCLLHLGNFHLRSSAHSIRFGCNRHALIQKSHVSRRVWWRLCENPPQCRRIHHIGNGSVGQ